MAGSEPCATETREAGGRRKGEEGGGRRRKGERDSSVVIGEALQCWKCEARIVSTDAYAHTLFYPIVSTKTH